MALFGQPSREFVAGEDESADLVGLGFNAENRVELGIVEETSGYRYTWAV
jgi:hypothetical protein